MKFEIWLKKQKDRDDPIGDLATDYIKARNYYRNPYCDRHITDERNCFDIIEQMKAWDASLAAYNSLFQALEEFENKPCHEDAASDLYWYHNQIKLLHLVA